MILRKMILGLLTLQLCGCFTFAQPERSFKVGDKVDVYYAASWYPGTIMSVGKSARGQICYNVRYDQPGYSDSCAFPDRLRKRGVSISKPFTLEVKDTFGMWNLAGSATTTSQEGDRTYRHTFAAATGSVKINADGTYVWTVGKDHVIRGKWKEEPNPKRYKGPVILVNGWLEMNWWVNYEGRDDLGKESVYVSSEMNTSYSGFKAQEKK